MDDKALITLVSVVSALLGALFGHWLRSSAWRRETQHSLFKARYEEGIKFLDDLSKLVGRRFFLLQRLLWSLEESPVIAVVQKREEEYYAAVKDWNFSYWATRNKIRLLVGDSFANDFLDYSDNRTTTEPNSLHYKFCAAHKCVALIRNQGASVSHAQSSMVELNRACSVFLERVTHEFIKRATALQLLEVPYGVGDAEQSLPVRHSVLASPRRGGI